MRVVLDADHGDASANRLGRDCGGRVHPVLSLLSLPGGCLIGSSAGAGVLSREISVYRMDAGNF